ncbi:MAG: site-specific DNA-methyltransferase [Dermatophilaceae bacterium]|nr:site-specific DNA-methyltransferase [Dermatophilaceae bacterium]MBP9919226.1 site-specific DNA-methyltransferase [Dermatophilaceae bacterium]
MTPDNINEVPSTTPDLQTELARQLQELVPEAITDGKVDVAKLTELLAADAADSNERFGLFWPGKKRALRAAQEPTTATLRPMKDQSKDWDTTRNVFIEGDNLEVLKILQKHYHGKIKMIYIDPPYNTGKDFVYPDNYKEGLETYLEWTKQVNEDGKKVSTNSESEGRYHSNWLNMMYPRLKLARNLLTQDGVIFISIDDNEFDNLHKITNEVFGEGNEVGVFSVTKAEGGGLAKHVIKGHDYLLAYARSIDSFKPLMRPKDIRGKVVEKDGEDHWIEEDWLRKEFGKYGTCPYEEIVKYHGGAKKAEIDQGLASGAYVLLPKGGQNIVGRYRKVSEDGSKFYSILKHLNKNGVKDLEELGRLDKYFDYPKPLSLLKELVLGATIFTKNQGEIVLDFFAGSGTTAQAVMDLNAEDGGNRCYIAVQLPEPIDEKSSAFTAGYRRISEITRERLSRAGAKATEKYADAIAARGGAVDVGYRTYSLADTNFTKWRITSATEPGKLERHLLSLRDSAEDDATADALLSELLLKQGYSLTEEYAEQDIAGLTVHAVGGGLLLAYLDEHTKPTLDQLRAVVDEEPARFVILEDAFHGDDELKTNVAQLCKSKGVELWTA